MLLIAAFVVLVVIVAWAVDLLLGFGVAGLLIALVVAGAAAFIAYWKSDAVALRMSHARPADPEQYARLHNVVEGLCIAAGLPKPRLYVIDDPAPNAFATGRDPRHAAIAVTTGLLDTMNRVELEGVLAHELSHIKNYDILVSTLAVTLVGLPALTHTGVGSRDAVRRQPPARGVGRRQWGLPDPLPSRPHLGPREAQGRQDRRALQLSRHRPPLDRITARARRGRGAVLPVQPLFETHPPLDERIKVLREL